MKTARIRLYAELNEYLSPKQRQRDFTAVISEGQTIGRMVTGLGIPAGEIDLILLNGVSADLDNRIMKRLDLKDRAT